VIEAAFVVVGSRDRLVLEGNVVEPGPRRSAAQAREGHLVALGIDLSATADDEMDRPADEDAAAAAIELSRGGLAQGAEDDRDQFLERELPTEYVGAIEQAAGEKRLERLNEAAAGAGAGIAVGLDGLRPGDGTRQPADGVVVGIEVEHGAKRGGRLAVE